MTRVGSALVMFSFALMFVMPLLSSPAQLAVIVISALAGWTGVVVLATLASAGGLILRLRSR